MKTKFSLVFDDRDDGTKVWSAECQRCGGLVVGERYAQVTVLRVSPEMPTSQFEQIKEMARGAWNHARETGFPVIIGDSRIEVDKTIDSGDLQRALEAHAAACPKRDLPRPEPTSLPGSGEPRR